MRELVTLLKRALEHPDVRAAAVVGTERRLIQGRFDDRADAVMELAQMARQLFRETRPEPAYADLELDRGRLVLVPVGDAVLVMEADRRFQAPVLLSGLTDALEDVAGGTEITRRILAIPSDATGSLPSPDATAPQDDGPDLTDIVMIINAATGLAKVHLGGPVIRNYLKKSRDSLLASAPRLDGFEIDYEGVVTAEGIEPGSNRELARAVRAWMTAFFNRSASMVPALGAVDVEILTAGLTADTSSPANRRHS